MVIVQLRIQKDDSGVYNQLEQSLMGGSTAFTSK